MRTTTVCLLAIGTFYFSTAQTEDCANTIHIEGVEVIAQNAEYLKNIQDHNTPRPVKALEYRVAKYNIDKDSRFAENLDLYEIVFKDGTNGNGYIRAQFDNAGKVVSANEKFDAITPPFEVRNTIFKEHPGWDLYSSSYEVSYSYGKEPKKHYKVKLRKDRSKKNLKLDAQGNYLN